MVREEDYREAQKARGGEPAANPGQKILGAFFFLVEALKPLLIGLLLLGGVVAAFIFLKFRGGDFLTLVLRHSPRTEKNIDIPAPRAKPGQPAPGDAKAGRPSAAARLVLSPDEQAVLSRRLELDPKRDLSKMEMEILNRHVPLRTGRIEKLPAPAWGLDQFKQMLEEQQRFYKVPLPRSYRNNLQKLFEAEYLPASKAFSEGKLIEARNFWVESLLFPIYANNIERHRGVVLTMLKPFINDTLSKIGAMNAMLAEGPVRDLEIRVSQAYDHFIQLLQARSWDAAYDAAEGLLAMNADFDQQAGQAPKVVPYPPSFSGIDRDIGKALLDLLESPRPSAADIGALQRDVRMKKNIIETLLPEKFSKELDHYRVGLEAISQADWQKAVQAFESVKAPALLARDSEEKLRIIQRILKAALDAQPVLG